MFFKCLRVFTHSQRVKVPSFVLVFIFFLFIVPKSELLLEFDLESPAGISSNGLILILLKLPRQMMTGRDKKTHQYIERRPEPTVSGSENQEEVKV